jgi:hypothetical protein
MVGRVVVVPCGCGVMSDDVRRWMGQDVEGASPRCEAVHVRQRSVVVSEHGGHGGGDPESNVMLGYYLVHPDRLRDLWFLPIGMALFFGIPVYLPTYSRNVLLFAALVCVPLEVWCVTLSVWARRNRLTGDTEADARRILDATAAQLLLATVLTPVFAILCLLVGLHLMLSIHLIGSMDYVFVSLLCFFGIILCLFVPEERLRIRTDWLRKKWDGSPWDWLLGTRMGCALLITVVFGTVFVISNAMSLEFEEALGAFLLGPLCVVGAFVLVPFASISYHKWKRLTGLREAGRAFVAGGLLSTSPEFTQESLPIWCVQCDKQGLIFVDDIEQPYFVVCKRCGWETSEVYCPKCNIGGEFVEDVGKRPTSWRCPDCGTEYDLPESFYDKPVLLYLEEDLGQPVGR